MIFDYFECACLHKNQGLLKISDRKLYMIYGNDQKEVFIRDCPEVQLEGEEIYDGTFYLDISKDPEYRLIWAKYPEHTFLVLIQQGNIIEDSK